jgi:hypothetical protein
MATEYPILSKLLDAKWFKGKMNCPKKVAFEYVSVNSRFQSAFGAQEKMLQDMVNEAEGELIGFLETGLSETAKKKIKIMTASVKKESDEKKAKKAKEKYGTDISGKQPSLNSNNDDDDEGKDEEFYEDSDVVSSSSTSNEASSSPKEEKRKTKEPINEAALKELFGPNASSSSSSSSLPNSDGKEPLSIDTSNMIIGSKTTSSSSDTLASTPKRGEAPIVHQKLIKLSKANLFGVYDKDGKPVKSEILMNGENEIHITLSQ